MLYEHHPLAGREIAVRTGASLNIRPAADAARFSLRIDPSTVTEAATAFGCALPGRIGAVTAETGRLAVQLGPDEWYLMAPPAAHQAIERAFANLYAAIPHSLADVSHREVGIEIEGAAGVLALRSAIAFDLEAMPAGTGCRTIFDRTQVILIREAEERFRIEVWRSFADHVWGILQAASREIALDI